MNIDISNYIDELLYEHDSVIIPGFGGFISSYKPVSIDYVQGLLHPPSKTLTFHDNFTVDDGMLLHFIRNKNKLDLEQSKTLLDSFVVKMQAALEKREIVVFPNVGRLYYNYEHKLQFLQDNTNFNRQAFGLPVVQFYPILRNQESFAAEAPVPVSDLDRPASASRTARLASFTQKAMPVFLVCTFVLLAMTIYTFNKKDYSSTASTLPVSERLNQKPTHSFTSLGGYFIDASSKLKTAEEPPIAQEDLIDEDESDFETEEITIEDFKETESTVSFPEQNACIIIIGAFSKKSGVRKRIEELYQLGFDAYQDSKNGLTRVGAQFAYDSPYEIEQNLRLLRKKFDKHAWVLKQD